MVGFFFVYLVFYPIYFKRLTMKKQIKDRFKQIILKEAKRIVFESSLIDDSLRSKIKDFYDLQIRVQGLEEELKKAKDQFSEVKDVLEPVFNSMKETNMKLLEVEDYVIQIKRYSSERGVIPYKEAYELGLTKVNEATKKILIQAAESTKKISKVATSFVISQKGTLGEMNFNYYLDNDTVKSIKGRLNNVINKFMNMFNKQVDKIDEGTEDMKRALKGKK